MIYVIPDETSPKTLNPIFKHFQIKQHKITTVNCVAIVMRRILEDL